MTLHAARLSYLMIVATLAGTWRPAAGQSPPADVSILVPYIGEWRAEDRTTEDGRAFHFEYRLRWFDASKTIAEMTITQVFDLGDTELLWKGFKGWDPENQRVYYHGFSPSGRAGRGVVLLDRDSLITRYTGWTADGQQVEIRDAFSPVEDNSFTSVTTLGQAGSWSEIMP